jgi:hypothetical protein
MSDALGYGPTYLAAGLFVIVVVGFIGWWLDTHRPARAPWEDTAR